MIKLKKYGAMLLLFLVVLLPLSALSSSETKELTQILTNLQTDYKIVLTDNLTLSKQVTDLQNGQKDKAILYQNLQNLNKKQTLDSKLLNKELATVKSTLTKSVIQSQTLKSSYKKMELANNVLIVTVIALAIVAIIK